MKRVCPICEDEIGIGRRYYVIGAEQVHCKCWDEQRRLERHNRCYQALRKLQVLLEVFDQEFAASGLLDDALEIIDQALKPN